MSRVSGSSAMPQERWNLLWHSVFKACYKPRSGTIGLSLISIRSIPLSATVLTAFPFVAMLRKASLAFALSLLLFHLQCAPIPPRSDDPATRNCRFLWFLEGSSFRRAGGHLILGPVMVPWVAYSWIRKLWCLCLDVASGRRGAVGCLWPAPPC